MEVYHASTVVVDRPDTTHSRSFLDFGPGFYVTTILDQAQKYGARFSRRGKNAVLNIYQLADDLSKWKVIEFKRYDEAWLNVAREEYLAIMMSSLVVLPTIRYSVLLTFILLATLTRMSVFAA